MNANWPEIDFELERRMNLALKLQEQLNSIIIKIIEVAQPHDDTETEGMVFMPDEDEWGEIVGLARSIATANSQPAASEPGKTKRE
jgi:hypothetical protein